MISLPHFCSVGADFAVAVVPVAGLEHRHVLTNVSEPLGHIGASPANVKVKAKAVPI